MSQREGKLVNGQVNPVIALMEPPPSDGERDLRDGDKGKHRRGRSPPATLPAPLPSAAASANLLLSPSGHPRFASDASLAPPTPSSARGSKGRSVSPNVRDQIPAIDKKTKQKQDRSKSPPHRDCTHHV